MFRRIEIVDKGCKTTPFGVIAFVLKGEKLDTYLRYMELMQAVPLPKRKRIGRRPRFYFTEEGWKKIGRELAATCRKMDWGDVCITKVKEGSVEVMYRDWCQVSVRPRKKRP